MKKNCPHCLHRVAEISQSLVSFQLSRRGDLNFGDELFDFAHVQFFEEAQNLRENAPVEAECMEFFGGVLSQPALLDDAIGADGETGAIGAVKAMNEDRLIGGVAQNLEELRQFFAAGKPG